MPPSPGIVAIASNVGIYLRAMAFAVSTLMVCGLVKVVKSSVPGEDGDGLRSSEHRVTRGLSWVERCVATSVSLGDKSSFLCSLGL